MYDKFLLDKFIGRKIHQMLYIYSKQLLKLLDITFQIKFVKNLFKMKEFVRKIGKITGTFPSGITDKKIYEKNLIKCL